MSVIKLKQSNLTPVEAAKALTKPATASDVRNVLKLAVATSLDSLDLAEVISIIVERTNFKATDVRKSLKMLVTEAKLKVPDEAQALATEVWENVFGGQFKAGPDGRCWSYTGTHWEMFSDQQVRKSLNAVLRAPTSPYSGKTKPTVDAALTILKDMCGGDPDPMTASFDQKAVINSTNGEL
jgi:hypothetical protein